MSLPENDPIIEYSGYTCLLCGARDQKDWPRSCCDGRDRSRMTLGELMKEVNVPGHDFYRESDTALPMDWVYAVIGKTGINPAGNFVWSYVRLRLSGEPVAMTNVAQRMRQYQAVRSALPEELERGDECPPGFYSQVVGTHAHLYEKRYGVREDVREGKDNGIA